MSNWKMEFLHENQSVRLINPEGFIFSFRSIGHLLEELANLADPCYVALSLKYGDAVEIEGHTRRLVLVNPDHWHNGDFNFDDHLGTASELAKVMAKFVELRLNGEI